MTTRRPTALLVGGLTLLCVLLTGCSSDEPPAHARTDSPSAPASHTPSVSPTASPTQPAFNPCVGVDAPEVSRALGQELTKETGSADTPRCALVPVKKGGPTFELSYLWFDQGLEAAWSTMQGPAGTVTRPAVAGADDARLVVNDSGSAYAASAFLQNGDLSQTVNALALPPYDAPKLRRATNVLLRQLSAAAPAAQPSR